MKKEDWKPQIDELRKDILDNVSNAHPLSKIFVAEEKPETLKHYKLLHMDELAEYILRGLMYPDPTYPCKPKDNPSP